MTFDYSTIEEQFQKLPEEVQYALTSPHITEKIKEIAEKNGLLLDQMEALYDITSYVMLGLLPSDRYTSTLAREMNISEKQAKIITDEINNEVFLEIRNSMREFEEKSRSTNNVVSNFTQNQYNRSNNNQIPTIPVPSSPHADLEQAGDFKIENESSTDNSYSLKSPQRKSTFVIEPKKEQPMSKLADMAMFTPKTEETEQLPKAEPEKPTLVQETVPTRIEQSTQETTPISTNTKQIVREYPIQKAPEPEYEPKKDSVPAFDPKNFYNFSNIETDSNIAKIENEFKKDNVKENDTKADSNLKSDSVVDSGQVFQKSASQIHYEKEAKNKHSKMSASQSYQPKIREFVKTDTT